MKQKLSHRWDLSEEEAITLQQELAQKVILEDSFSEIRTVAGVDVAYDKNSNKLVAAVAVLDATTLKMLETSSAQDIERFPYVPGLFSFRELPPISQALSKLHKTPDLIVCDGHGIAHPRRFGLACHLGVLFDVPTIGCAKTRLFGVAEMPDEKRGSAAPLLDGDEKIGAVLRTQDNVKPVYVSVGHRVSLETATKLALQLASRYRLPETTRHVDQLVKALLDGKPVIYQ